MAGILVIRGGAIGDFILTLPVLSALRAQFPQARLELLGYAHIASLAAAGGLVEAVRSIESASLAGFFARGGKLSPELADYFSGFSIIVSYLYDPDGIFRANVASCSRAQFIQGPHRPDESASLPASLALLQPLERLAIFEADPVPRLVLPQPELTRPPTASPPLALHPGSGSERKNWPEAKWSQLLALLAPAAHRPLLLVGGEAEGSRLEKLAQQLDPRRGQVARNLPLPELAERLTECRVFIGHDSGISHLAAALGLPGLVLWGESNESVWRPPSPRVLVLRDPAGLAHLSVERVLAALEDMLGR